jgi:hypothetical protein
MKRVLLSALVGVSILALTGCSDKDENLIKGRVIDYYIKDANVTTATQKVKSDKYGWYTLKDRGESITAVGGVDIATGEDFLGKLKAPAGSTVVNSFTTLTQVKVENGSSLKDAKAAVKAKFGIDDSVELTTYDPIKALVDNANDSVAKETFAKQAQVQAILNTTAALLKEEAKVDSQKAFETAAKTIMEAVTKPEDIENNVSKVTETVIKETVKEVAPDKVDEITPKAEEVAVKIEEIVKQVEETLEEATDPVEIIKTTEAAIAVAQDLTIPPSEVENKLKELKESISDANITTPLKEETITGAEG